MKSDNEINNVIADRISGEIYHVFDFLNKFRRETIFSGDGNHHIVLFFIYLFSKNLLEKFLMNLYFNNLSRSDNNKATNTLVPFKKSDDLPSHVVASIYNIEKINLKLNPCSNEEINIIIEKLSKENNSSFQKIYDEFSFESSKNVTKRYSTSFSSLSYVFHLAFSPFSYIFKGIVK